jgi:hypothetical protein
MDTRLTPATHAHRLYQEVKNLRAALADDGYSADTVYYVVMSAIGRLAQEDAEKEYLKVMMRDMLGDVKDPIEVPQEMVSG